MLFLVLTGTPIQPWPALGWPGGLGVWQKRLPLARNPRTPILFYRPKFSTERGAGSLWLHTSTSPVGNLAGHGLGDKAKDRAKASPSATCATSRSLSQLLASMADQYWDAVASRDPLRSPS